MNKHFAFNRMELSGSLGDLGTILPLALAMIVMNGVNPSAVFFCFGLYYVLAGLYFKVTMPVEPMKVIAAYAIAANISVSEIQSSSLLLAVVLLLLGGTGLIRFIGSNMPIAVIRGVQFSTGILLIEKGIQLMTGTSAFQQILGAGEPYLILQNLGILPIGIIIGVVLFMVALLLLDNRKMPAAIVVVAAGFAIGLALQAPETAGSIEMEFWLPSILPYGLPSLDDFGFALLVLVLPQIPMTIGNAVIASADLCATYFPETGKKVSGKSLCLSMGLANLLSFVFGGIPMCHGAGGLASRYRFGARTAGSNMIIGILFIALTFVFGTNILTLLNYIPMSALGVLLIFAGSQLCLSLTDRRSREDIFIVAIMLALTLAFNLAASFLIGIVLALVLKKTSIRI